MRSEVCEKESPTLILPAIFLVSFAAIAWQLALMRCLLISKYHHFTFLIISCALLGFGASGVILGLFRRWFHKHADGFLLWGNASFALSIPISFILGEMLPLQVYFPPDNLWETVGLWSLFWLIHVAPFLLAGMLIGLELSDQRNKSHVVYAASLLGSATGAVGGIIFLSIFPANGIAALLSLCVMVSCFPLGLRSEVKHRNLCIGTLMLICGLLIGSLVAGIDRCYPLNVDEYKTLAYAQRLANQGAAAQKCSIHGLRGRIDVFASPHFHSLLSLNSDVRPPPMDVILKDGFHVGVLPLIESPTEARFLEGSLFGIPYRLIEPRKILILGDSGAVHLWLARLSAADLIVLVHPDKNVIRVLENHQSRVLQDPRIRIITNEPRAFLDQNKILFDIIVLAGLEGFAPGSSGIGGLREDYLGTVEGFSKLLDALSTSGMASVVRGIQDPPRDNIKIFATWVEALERQHVEHPGDRLLVARDELACATLSAKSDVSPDQVERFWEVCHSMSWDIEWCPQIQPKDSNQIHRLPGPQGSTISWFHHGIREILSTHRQDFYQNWICNIQPATDDKPYFQDFFKLRSVSALREVLGPIWPTRSEMGFLLLIMSAVFTALAACLLIPFPVLSLKRSSPPVSLSVTIWSIAFFATIGAGFMFLEMSFIQMFTRFLGDPILAAGLVIGGFLFFAGAGSIAQPLLMNSFRGGILVITGGVSLITLLYSVVLPSLFGLGASLSDIMKIVTGLGVIAPLAFLMGAPFPWALSVLKSKASDIVPVAWAVNGFASVVASSVAVIIAMVYGFQTLCISAGCLYAGAGISWLISNQFRNDTRQPQDLVR